MDSENVVVSLRKAILATPNDSRSYAANIPPDHCYGAGKQLTAHGGVLTSIIQSAIKSHFQTTLKKNHQPDTLDLSLTFLRPATSGPCIVFIKPLKLGYAISQISFSLVQDEKECVNGYASNGNLGSAAHGISLPTPAITPCKPVNFETICKDGLDENWISYRIPWHQGSLIKPITHFMFLNPLEPLQEKNVTEIWMKFAEPSERFSTEMLGSVVDHWHRMPENYLRGSMWNNDQITTRAKKNPGGNIEAFSTSYLYPTLSLKLEIKKPLPEEGVEWLLVRAQSNEIRNGRFDATIKVVTDKQGLVALSHQVCFILPGKQVPDSKM
ncbi:MAG: hypothetical protein M1820_002959 [Bogoriella megaspora]|nr:MAG: hypothetical protein M1820_002959 [Bogoriella megaspora]